MASIEQLKGSDGSGNANVATIQNTRSSGASTIIVDTVLGINPGGFAGSMGTPHTFTDPITSEIITVISEATAVDFTGHVDGGNLEIDDIAPGYVDNGSEVGDIVIIRPTTQWSDNLGEVLEVSHNDDGTLKDDIVTTDKILDDAVTAPKIVGIDKSNLTLDYNPYKFSAYKSVAQNYTAGQVAKVVLQSELFDTNNNFDAVTNSRYVAPVAGFYLFNGAVTSSADSNKHAIYLYKNGAIVKQGSAILSGVGTITQTFVVSSLIQLAATDYIEMWYANGSGVTFAVSAGEELTYLSGILLCRT